MSPLDLFQLHPSSVTPTPTALPDPTFLDTVTARRHFIAATGDTVGASGVDGAFTEGRGWREK